MRTTRFLYLATYLELIMAESAIKKYPADWREDSSAEVYRDSSGKFASKGGTTNPLGTVSKGISDVNKQSIKQIDSLKNLAVTKLNKISKSLRHELTEAYRKNELKIAFLSSHKTETFIQDKLIELKVLEDRNILEELGDAVVSPDDAKKFYDKHQAEVSAAAAAIIVGANAIFLPTLAAVASVAFLETIVAGIETTSVSMLTEAIVSSMTEASIKFGLDKYYENADDYDPSSRVGMEILIQTLAISLTHNAFKASRPKIKSTKKNIASVYEDLYGKTSKSKTTSGVESPVQIDPQISPKNPKVPQSDIAKTLIEYGDQQIAALESEFPDALKQLGLDKAPKTFDELKDAYYKIAKKAHPGQGGSEEEFAALGKAYALIRKAITQGKK